MVVVFRIRAINANPSADTSSPRVFTKKGTAFRFEHRPRASLPAQPAGQTPLPVPAGSHRDRGRRCWAEFTNKNSSRGWLLTDQGGQGGHSQKLAPLAFFKP
jgi:hypothetical protein